ncbi:MAG: Rpn family recombination-promoting nuclease/putative transposase, partial [Gomphosphaeria aponina SAG 52.96 = DSM 107014]|nr:Rpn family recombination-promoting nuclease/putative transposase [Gomphosphaeria aponina SAG 52.96 = DSM 107014]
MFISPKNDYAFKKIFGSEDSKEILISFLNAIIYQERPLIQDLTIANPYIPGKIVTLKDTYLDIKAILDNKTTVLIEMQLQNMTAFDKRIQYNLAKTYSNQLVVGEKYYALTPVISLRIMDFILFEETAKVINSFVFKEEEELFNYKDKDLKMLFVELPRFQKKLEELETLTDKWLYFLKEAPILQEIPQSMENIPAIKSALNLAKEGNLTREELEQFEARLTYIRDQEATLDFLKNEVKAKIKAEGKAEGLAQGEIKGEIKSIIRLLKKKFGELGEIPEMLSNLS